MQIVSSSKIVANDPSATSAVQRSSRDNVGLSMGARSHPGPYHDTSGIAIRRERQAGTYVGRILRGDKQVSIFGTMYDVKADVERIESYSGHGDYKEMMNYLECQDKTKLQKVFVVHGEYSAQQQYKEKLETAGYKNIEIPERGEEFEL